MAGSNRQNSTNAKPKRSSAGSGEKAAKDAASADKTPKKRGRKPKAEAMKASEEGAAEAPTEAADSTKKQAEETKEADAEATQGIIAFDDNEKEEPVAPAPKKRGRPRKVKPEEAQQAKEKAQRTAFEAISLCYLANQNSGGTLCLTMRLYHVKMETSSG